MNLRPPKSSRSWRLLACLIYVIFACVRIPVLLRQCRFWAEEGTIYFVSAWDVPWWQALLKPEIGYLSLAANSAGVLARYAVPLEYAPRITTGIALAIQTLPAFLLVTASDRWLRRPIVLYAATALLAMPSLCDEVWLNTANSQFHLALAAALCLVLETRTGLGATAQNLLLVLAPLCSPASVALVPLFAARSVMDRDRRRAVQAFWITAGTAVQVLFFYTPLPGRGHVLGPATLAATIAVKNLAIPLLGEQGAAFVSRNVTADILSGHYPIFAFFAVGTASVLLLGAAAVLRRPEPFWLLASGAAIAGLSYYGALDGERGLTDVIAGNRYVFAPNMLFALAVLALAAAYPGRVSVGAWLVVLWLLAIAIRQTVLPHDTVFTEGPRWHDEVARWRTDPGRALAIWPAGWSMHLRP